jgi:UDP-N-acetyl-D-mannosaminuronic acid dehydrogenase
VSGSEIVYRFAVLVTYHCEMPKEQWPVDVTVMGGCGHVGLPLGLALADAGLTVALYDVDLSAVDRVSSGKMPHLEPGAPEVLSRVLANGNLSVSADASTVASAEHVIVVLGTPIDEHFNPDPQALIRALERVADQLHDGQLLILRSTVFPGVTRMVERLMHRLDKAVDVAFCPERIAEGRAMEELSALPQIVSARTNRSFDRAAALFGHLTDKIVRVAPEEAELAKLFTNTYRYIKFAAANQLYMMANDFGLDFERIRAAVIEDYPRAADLPGPGFAAGPCLLKDTMQLAAFNNNNFALGQASMQVNEGLPLYLTARMAARYDLASMTVGILGMAFKGESDDTRSSLSYKLKRVLGVRAAGVLTTDPYVTTDGDLWALDEVLARSDLIVIGAPHKAYAEIDIPQPVVDIWNLRGGGVCI